MKFNDLAADCEQPASPVHGMVTVTPISSGYLATYECDEGYILVGHRERTCDTSNGVWTHSPPTCQGELINIMLELGEGDIPETVVHTIFLQLCTVKLFQACLTAR